MKRIFIPLIILLNITLFTGCNSKTSTLSAEEQKAVNNSIKFIKDSSFTSKNRIDTDIIEINNATKNTWKSVVSGDSRAKENATDSTDWIITIGDTTHHDFAIIVCDSSTYEVIGFIPIK